MSRGDPIEFVRTLLNGNRQRVGNRTQREGFLIEADHCAHPAREEDAIVILPAPGIGPGGVPGDPQLCWRFDYVHYSYDIIPQAPGQLTVTDFVTAEIFYIVYNVGGYLPFESTRWAGGAAVHIVLQGVAGAHGSIAVHGARVERVIGP